MEGLLGAADKLIKLPLDVSFWGVRGYSLAIVSDALFAPQKVSLLGGAALSCYGNYIPIK